MSDDPRDKGFNYGKGWGQDAKPAIYLEATLLAQKLGRERLRLSAQEWELQMCLWRVRIATTGAEKGTAVRHLWEWVEAYRAGQVEMKQLPPPALWSDG